MISKHFFRFHSKERPEDQKNDLTVVPYLSCLTFCIHSSHSWFPNLSAAMSQQTKCLQVHSWKKWRSREAVGKPGKGQIGNFLHPRHINVLAVIQMENLVFPVCASLLMFLPEFTSFCHLNIQQLRSTLNAAFESLLWSLHLE